LGRKARNSGTMPPAFKAEANFAEVAPSKLSGAIPISVERFSQPLAQVTSLAA